MEKAGKQERVHLETDEALAAVTDALLGLGHDVNEAGIVADHIIDAALCGYEYLGLSKVLRLADHFRPDRGEISVTRTSDFSARVDAANNVGMLAMPRAVEELLHIAEQHGFAIVSVVDAWMSGRSAYYCEKVARAGLICIHTASGPPLVAPPGGTMSALGTNPVAFGFPTDGEPLVIDIGTSAIAASDLELHDRIGDPLPPDVAIDPTGSPTTDPRSAVAGSLLPFGGHKGFALALAMHAMGVLCAPKTAEGFVAGHVLIGFSPDLLLPDGQYETLLTEQLRIIRETPRRPDVDVIRIPGERAQQERERSLRKGITVDRDVLDGIHALARRRV